MSASSASSGLSPCAWSRSPFGPVAHAVQVAPRMAGSAKPSSADDRATYGITPSLPMAGCNTKPAASPKPPRMCQPASLLGISSPATLFSRRVTGPDVRRIVGQRPCRAPYSAHNGLASTRSGCTVSDSRLWLLMYSMVPAEPQPLSGAISFPGSGRHGGEPWWHH